MASPGLQRRALVLSCEGPGEESIPGAGQNAEKLSKFFRRANVATECVYGGKLSFNHVIGKLQDFFSNKCDLHILYGIFHGHAGFWKLSDGGFLRLQNILQCWDLAKLKGTAKYLLIVSDACQSGHMVNEMVIEDFLSARGDVAVQASCSPCNPTYDMVGETFTELLLWKLQGQKMKRERDERICNIERALLSFGPCYYCPDQSNYRGWIFVDEDGSDQSSQIFSLEADSSDTTSQGLSSAEPDGAPSFPQPDNGACTHRAGRIQPRVYMRSHRQATFRQACWRDARARFLIALLLFLHRWLVELFLWLVDSVPPRSSLIYTENAILCFYLIFILKVNWLWKCIHLAFIGIYYLLCEGGSAWEVIWFSTATYFLFYFDPMFLKFGSM